MATEADFRRVALQQPGAEEKSHFGHPDFRVGGKIFASLQPDKGLGVLKLPPELMWNLTREDEHLFEPAKGFERGGWTRIRLAKVTTARLRELTPIAWATVAPKRLQAGASQGKPPKPATPKVRKARR